MSNREVMQQALEALERADKDDFWREQHAAITALRAALAEPQDEPAGTKSTTHEAIAQALSEGAPLSCDQRAVLLGLVADDKVWQRECDRLQRELAAIHPAPQRRLHELEKQRKELLEALKRILQTERGTSGRIIIDRWLEDAIRDAIAKAEGKQ